MENFNYNENKNYKNKLPDSSKLSISLRKKKLNQKLNEVHILNETNITNKEEENENMTKLCTFSKSILEQKEIENFKNILDKIYFFIINIKIPLKPNFIKLSCIMPNLYQKLLLFEMEEIVLKKIFDVFGEIIKFLQPDDLDDCSNLFNEQHFQLIYRLIELYQNNQNMMNKIFYFLSNLIKLSNYIKEYLMIKPDCYFIQSILSLDVIYPEQIIQLMYSFVNYENLNDKTMEDFEILFIQECDKLTNYFYKKSITDTKIIMNNLKLLQNLYSCLSFISISENKEIKDIFFYDNKNDDINLYEKIIFLEKYDREHLAVQILRILNNFFCYPELKYIQIIIENKYFQYAIDRIFDQFSNENIIKESANALANFVNTVEYRKIFIEKKYIIGIINITRKSNRYDITDSLLFLISNIIYATKEIELLSFIDTDIIPCCIELLLKIKEPTLLDMLLKIIQLLLIKGDPNTYIDCYCKKSEDKILNPFKYQFDTYGLYDILSNMQMNCKHENVIESIKNIFVHFYK